MGVEENKKVAMELITAMGVCDIATVERLLHEDAIWDVIGTTKASGRKTKERNIKLIKSAYSYGNGTMNYKFGDVTAQGDTVWIEVWGDFEMKQGPRYANTYLFKCVVKDGKVIAGREIMDTGLVDKLFGPKEQKPA